MEASSAKVFDKLGEMLDSWSLAVVGDFLIEKKLVDGTFSLRIGEVGPEIHKEPTGLQWFSGLFEEDPKGNLYGVYDILIRSVPVPVYFRISLKK